MLFNSWEFLFLLAGTFALYHLPVPGMRRKTWQVWLLLAASAIFYAWEEPRLLILLSVSCLVNAIAVERILFHKSRNVEKSESRKSGERGAPGNQEAGDREQGAGIGKQELEVRGQEAVVEGQRSEVKGRGTPDLIQNPKSKIQNSNLPLIPAGFVLTLPNKMLTFTRV